MILELIWFGGLGLAMGSFLTLVVERFDTIESIWRGRSHCNFCKKPLGWRELVPFLGYFLIRGQCRQCQRAIPKIYPVFELITAAVFMVTRAVATSPTNYGLLALELGVMSVLLALVFYDWLNQAFPSWFLATAAVMVVGLVVYRHLTGQIPPKIGFNPVFSWLAPPDNFWFSRILGASVGAGWLGLLAFPSRGRWMGYGDVILITILGFWLGYPDIIICLLLAFYAGALAGLALMAIKKVPRDHRVAFGPFLIFAAIATDIWRPFFFSIIIRLWGAA